jgi:TDG/mug DNA glycosylase family protein
VSTTAAPRVRSFAPVFRADARVLVLGSMPGEASLAAAEYYAHPRNAFWPIMGALFGASPRVPYAERLQDLIAAGVALWDVIGTCARIGSLDSAIAPDSVEANDFAALFAACPHISHVFFNGAAAEAAFRRHVRRRIALPGLRFTRLPSTSPAHAAPAFAAKLAAWQAVRAAALFSAHTEFERIDPLEPGTRAATTRPTPAAHAA